MRRATVFLRVSGIVFGISIHALHEESDLTIMTTFIRIIRISIHALHEESDHSSACCNHMTATFQSTLSMRRATLSNVSSRFGRSFQSTLSMRRATHDMHGHDRIQRFQSTLSMRRATVQLDIFVRFLRRKPAA